VDVARQYGLDPDGRFVIVDQNRQEMYVVDQHVVRTLPISSGDPDKGFYTPAWQGVIGDYWGTFHAWGVWADDAWFLFRAPGGSILIHGAPYTVHDGVKQFQGLAEVGSVPASRGCIRLRPEDAAWFTAWRPKGVPIVILPYDGGTAREG